MKAILQHTAVKKIFVSSMSIAMIAVFVMLGVLSQQAALSKRSENKTFEKCRKSNSESDFLLFEEDDELSDENESDHEWLKDLQFNGMDGVLPVNFAINFKNFSFAFDKTFNKVHSAHTPIFICIRSLRI